MYRFYLNYIFYRLPLPSPLATSKQRKSGTDHKFGCSVRQFSSGGPHSFSGLWADLSCGADRTWMMLVSSLQVKSMCSDISYLQPC